VFLWPSIVFQPRQLLKAMLGARPWRQPPPLRERVAYREAAGDRAPAASPLEV
jgi:hypothetical protein